MDDFTDDRTFVLVGLFVAAIFIFVGCAILLAIVRGLIQWSRNNNSPLVTVPAFVVTKRHHVSGGSGDSSASTSYYVGFELQGGERLELQMSGQNFGLLSERDRGQLTHQGTRYKGFTRIPRDL
jgi:hypothetical protein